MSFANDYSGGRNILRAAVLIKTTRAGCPEDETSGGKNFEREEEDAEWRATLCFLQSDESLIGSLLTERRSPDEIQWKELTAEAMCLPTLH